MIGMQVYSLLSHISSSVPVSVLTTLIIMLDVALGYYPCGHCIIVINLSGECIFFYMKHVYFFVFITFIVF